jgi:hypothetical protein
MHQRIDHRVDLAVESAGRVAVFAVLTLPNASLRFRFKQPAHENRLIAAIAAAGVE